MIQSDSQDTMTPDETVPGTHQFKPLSLPDFSPLSRLRARLNSMLTITAAKPPLLTDIAAPEKIFIHA